MNTPLLEQAVQSEVPFCSLSGLMLSQRSDGLAVACGSMLIDWAHFRVDVQVLTRELQASAYQKWALCFDDSYYFAVAFMAAAHAGKQIILPGNHQLAALSELTCEFEALLHDRHELQTLDCPQVSLPLSGETQLKATSSVTESASFTENKLAEQAFISELQLSDVTVTLFTSGSSGRPKAVIKNLELIDAEIMQLERTWGEHLRGSAVVSTVSHQHIYGLLFRVLWPLCAGRVVARLDLSYPEQVMLQASPEITLITSPALLKRLSSEQATKPYRAIFSSGGPLSEVAAYQCFELFGKLPTEVFGSTETGGIGFRQQHSVSTPWQLFDVIDMELNAEDCLRLRSPFIEPSAWYQTSDQCRVINERQFILMGRTDRVVKIEEKRISLTEVEQRLCQLEWIDEAAVLPLDNAKRLVIAAVITLTAEGKKQAEAIGKGKFWLALRQQLRCWLEPVGIPRHFRVVDEIPLNSQGKRLVSELEQFFK